MQTNTKLEVAGGNNRLATSSINLSRAVLVFWVSLIAAEPSIASANERNLSVGIAEHDKFVTDQAERLAAERRAMYQELASLRFQIEILERQTPGYADASLTKTTFDANGPLIAQIPARMIHYVEPTYPQHALRAGVEGSISVLLTIDTEGRVSSAEITGASPSNTFDLVALAAAQQFRYEPRTVNGQTVEEQKEITFVFAAD